MSKQTFKDPVDKDKKKREEQEDLAQMKTLEISKLTLSDFKQVRQSAARIPHPFEGYAYPKGKDATFIVGLNPTKNIPQDPSGKNVSIIVKGKEKHVTIETTHNRVIEDMDGARQNMDIVFDRKMELADGNVIYYATVPSHSIRAQLVFYYDSKTQKVKVNPDYVLMDTAQSSKLRQLFMMIINPKLRKEQMAAHIAGESDDAPKLSEGELNAA